MRRREKRREMIGRRGEDFLAGAFLLFGGAAAADAQVEIDESVFRQLVGHRMGIGAKVAIYKAGQLGKSEALLGYQEIGIGYGYASGQLAVAHFGLGDAMTVDVRVTLPGGKGTIDKPGVKANQVLVVKE